MGKKQAAIFTEQLCKNIRMRCNSDSRIYKMAVKEAERFVAMSDDELRSLMFGSTLKRSYHVFSDGYCPACKGNVPLHNWRLDVIHHPWKVICPLCDDLFPKNDFYPYYRSGLDSDGIFQYEKADHTLLYNENCSEDQCDEHDMKKFGVDDGNGFEMDGNRWYFVAYYLLFGQWMQVVLEGIKCLSRAHVITGEKIYARKACIILSRVADVFPHFDFKKQGIIYEKEHNDVGYISYYFRTCTDLRDLVLAYDMIFDSVKEEKEFVHSLIHIEDRIFRDAVNNRYKFEANFPMTDTTICLVNTILSWPSNKAEIDNAIADITARATAVDGLTGERGLVVYSAYAFLDYAYFLSFYELIEPGFISSMIAKYPSIYDAYRFFIDTWCLQTYYPRIGNTGAFAKPDYQYAVFYYNDDFFTSYLDPDLDMFMWKLYEITGDSDFAKAVFISKGGRSELCFMKSILTENAEQLQGKLKQLIAEKGEFLEQKSINKEAWKLAVIHSGRNEDKRAIWMKYDSGGDHGHYDGMNIGLFAKGLDLMPDFGYPPVQYGRFKDRPEYPWYYRSSAHNTVVVDGKNHKGYAGLSPSMGVSQLWITGSLVKVIQANAPELIDGELFERTVICIDISEEDSYYVDIFRVQGGSEHVKFIRSSMGELSFRGLHFQPSEEFGHEGLMMKDYCVSKSLPETGWSAVWELDDSHFKVRRTESPVFLKYIDLTDDAEVYTAKSWVDLWPQGNSRHATDHLDMWIPTIMVKRGGEGRADHLRSDFIGIYEPYEYKSNIVEASKLPTTGNGIGIQLQLANNVKDTIVFRCRALPDIEVADIATDSEIAFIRKENDIIKHIAIINGSYLRVKETTFHSGNGKSFVEMNFMNLT